MFDKVNTASMVSTGGTVSATSMVGYSQWVNSWKSFPVNTPDNLNTPNTRLNNTSTPNTPYTLNASFHLYQP